MIVGPPWLSTQGLAGQRGAKSALTATGLWRFHRDIAPICSQLAGALEMRLNEWFSTARLAVAVFSYPADPPAFPGPR